MTSAPVGYLRDKGEDVTVLEPVELREMVVKIARGALTNLTIDGSLAQDS